MKIYADGADLASMRRLARERLIQGFTTNPTLMRQAGVTHYADFARDVLDCVSGRPVSFEVFADTLDEMERQALTIAAWGPNVYVKIPVTNTRGVSTAPVLRSLASQGVQVNVTALLTLPQVAACTEALRHSKAACISVFAGRIADTWRDPLPVMQAALEIMRPYPQLELIWASPRELLNIRQADDLGCHIITVTPELLKKLNLVDKDLDEYSLETVRMFYEDGKQAGLSLRVESPTTTPAMLVP
ncbi:MAG: transaldolase [Bryobacteraceae bacterium]|nr:transaldolase [Bryobacteraceae bacterium]